jgi:hypothetical protein
VTKFCVLSTFLIVCSLFIVSGLLIPSPAVAASPENGLRAYPNYEVYPNADPDVVSGYTPTQIHTAYSLPWGGSGTIAIIDAYDAPTAQSDLTYFSNYFGLPTPDYEEHHMVSPLAPDSGWALETALDIEWAHAIAPNAKILLVQAKNNLLTNLLAAVDYATSRPDVVAVSMSWSTNEFFGEASLDYHFAGPAFFASSGDGGAGVVWPASSARVVAVGGTTLVLDASGNVLSETAWSSSGGGSSAYISKPSYQIAYAVPGSMRGVPDVSYDANPSTGFPVYNSGAWLKVGGTSAGAPQWAAIYALGFTASNDNFYQDAASPSYASYFRDITSGSNGYPAGVGYDFVTGLGSPVTVDFTPSSTTTTTTSITLQPAGQSTPLSSTNQFAVAYTLNGVPQTANATDGTLTLTTDSNTNVVISGISTGSTATEKWVFDADDNPVSTPAGTSITLYYSDLLTQTTTYTVIGGGNPLTPTLSYVTAPATAQGLIAQTAATASLSQSTPTTIWALRGSTASVTNPLVGSSSEQWLTQTSTWIVTEPNSLPSSIAYYHQFLLEVTGAQTYTLWYNSNETAEVAVPGVFARASGTGQRMTSFAVDGGAPTPIMTIESTIISLVMNATHQLQLDSTAQYQVTLEAFATQQLASITPPTISGDNYWYDAGTPVILVLNGIGTRASGTGLRLAAYTVNGASTNVASVNPVYALSLTAITSPQTVSASLTTQYQLTTASGSINSITPPTIAGDAGWYDTGTFVTVTYDYSWNMVAGQSRLNALNYTVNQGAATQLNRSGSGTFQVQVVMTQPQNITIFSTAQYVFSVSGGNNVVLSLPSPTGDSNYDSGTTLTATSDCAWNVVNGTARQGLVSYSLDGATQNISRTDGGTFTTPIITFNRAHTLFFNSAAQFLISFQFRDNSGSITITPSAFQIDSTNLGVVDVPEFIVWLDNGTQFQIYSVIWQGTDVKPVYQTSYAVNSSFAVTVNLRIYDATLRVQDDLGAPIAGAQVVATLANQTVIQSATGSGGTLSLPMIPQGRFTATVTYLAASATVAGDASMQSVTTVTLTQPPSPTPSPSPSPSASPSSPSPSATPSPSPSPSASPTETPSPSPTSTSSPNPTPSPETPEFPYFIVLSFLIGAILIGMILVGALILERKRHSKAA